MCVLYGHILKQVQRATCLTQTYISQPPLHSLLSKMQTHHKNHLVALGEVNASDLYARFIRAIRPVLGDILTSFTHLKSKRDGNFAFGVTDLSEHTRKSLLFVEYCMDFATYLIVRLSETDHVLHNACQTMTDTITTRLEHASSKTDADTRNEDRFETLYKQMNKDIGLFDNSNLLADIIDEIPYIYWLLTTMNNFVCHILDIQVIVCKAAPSPQAHPAPESEANHEALARHPCEHHADTKELIKIIQKRTEIQAFVTKGHAQCCHDIPQKLEQIFLSRDMLSFLRMLRENKASIAQHSWMKAWDASMDHISKAMLAHVQVRFGEQCNVYGCRDAVRMRRTRPDLHGTTHDMLQNNHPVITLQIMDSTHDKFSTLVSTFISSMFKKHDGFRITFDFFFMAFLCPADQPLPTYHINPSKSNSIATNCPHTPNFSGEVDNDSFVYKIVQCMRANKVLEKIRTKHWSPIDTGLPRQPV